MADQRIADIASGTRQHVDHARRKDLGKRLGERERGQRRAGGRLEDDRVARRERRPDLPRGHVERVIPWRDRRDDPDRIATDERGVTRQVLRRGEAINDPAGACEEPEEVGTDGHLVDRRADGLAGVLALEPAELVRP